MLIFVLILIGVAAVLAGLASGGVNPVRPHLGWLSVCLIAIAAFLERLPG